MRVVRRGHAWEGRPLELTGWMHRHGRLELLVALPDGTRLLVPAAWTDLQAPVEALQAGTLASLDDLLAARRMLDPVLERVVQGERDHHGEEIDRAVASGVGGEPGAGGGALGAGRRAAAPSRDVAADDVDRAGPRTGGGGR
ncbi:MAG: hypothetical protein JOY56_02630 [Solirubrobacterales bacterium]|nr:hypothetical protein [Solirubrobacterales bacterium]MBV9809077.1 hypothetical protein [Solirubrobacterales bacterium]